MTGPRVTFYPVVSYKDVLVGASLWWIAIALILVLRDPTWRLFYEGRIVARAPTVSKWLELNEDLLEQLSTVPAAPAAGVTQLEEAFITAMNDHRAKAAAMLPATAAPPPLSAVDALTRLARGRAEARRGGVQDRPEFAYPEVALALAMPSRLIRVVEIAQVLPRVPPTGSPIPFETVGGWMNRIDVANTLTLPAYLEAGIGAIGPTAQLPGASVDAILIEVFAELDRPLAAITDTSAPLTITGRRVGDADLTFFIKGPQDASFKSLAAQWSQDRFTTTIDWAQGAGLYAIRVRRGDRLSDPRPVLAR